MYPGLVFLSEWGTTLDRVGMKLRIVTEIDTRIDIKVVDLLNRVTYLGVLVDHRCHTYPIRFDHVSDGRCDRITLPYRFLKRWCYEYTRIALEGFIHYLIWLSEYGGRRDRLI
jgi:hypothetical protein